MTIEEARDALQTFQDEMGRGYAVNHLNDIVYFLEHQLDKVVAAVNDAVEELNELREQVGDEE